MEIGAVFPQAEIGSDPAGIRAFAQAVQDLGYSHLLVYDHVLGGDPAAHETDATLSAPRPSLPSERLKAGMLPYSHENAFHEPFVLFGYLAAAAPGLELAPAIIIAPQRQTVLLAKQATEVAVLTNGRFRLGIGLGWNEIEYEALGMDFKNRGRRVEEQIEVMRRLWTEPIVTFKGEWHTITAAGLNPMPPGEIPIWFGANTDRALRRAARLGDGLMVSTKVLDEPEGIVEKMRGFVAEEGRDPEAFGIQGRMMLPGDDRDGWLDTAERWRACRASHLAVNSQFDGLRGADQHIERLEEAAKALGLRAAAVS